MHGGAELWTRELRGPGTLHRLDGESCAEVSCYILEELDRDGEPAWRGFCEVRRSDDLLPGRQRLVLQLDDHGTVDLDDARVSLEADSHSLRVTFRDAKPRRSAGVSTLRSLPVAVRNEERPEGPSPGLPPKPRIGIIGPGALGCLIGGLLAQVGHEVWMLCRRAQQAELLARQGIVIEEDTGQHNIPVRATAEPRRAAPLDLAIVLVKSYDTASAARSLEPALGPNSLVLTLQNGLGNVETLAERLGPERVLGGVTAQGATLLGPGRVRHAGSGPTAIGGPLAGRGGQVPAPRAVVGKRLPGAAQRARQTARLLTAAGLPTKAARDLRSLLWGKLVVSAAANGLTALSGLPNGELLHSPLNMLMDDLARETAAVAEAAGARLPYEDPVAHTRSVMLATAANRSSMLQDFEAGRPTEIGSLNEAVVAEGARLGVPTPLNEAIAALVRQREGTASVLCPSSLAVGTPV